MSHELFKRAAGMDVRQWSTQQQQKSESYDNELHLFGCQDQDTNNNTEPQAGCVSGTHLHLEEKSYTVVEEFRSHTYVQVSKLLCTSEGPAFEILLK